MHMAQNNGHLSGDQLGCVLEEIAVNASTIERLVLEWARAPGSEAAQAIPDALCALAQRIGWAADLANGGVGLRGGAENWMMPPLYHRAKKREQPAKPSART